VLLKEVYRRADMPKPRNLVGMAQGPPRAEMEALLLANIRVTEEAHARAGGAARRGCARLPGRQEPGPVERLFLGAAKKAVPAATDKTAAAAADKPDSAAPAAEAGRRRLEPARRTESGHALSGGAFRGENSGLAPGLPAAAIAAKMLPIFLLNHAARPLLPRHPP
jgi:hypothetical protein